MLGTMTLLPPRPEVCQTCACKHEDVEPHNAQSLYYQTKFNMENGRSATWLDAMAHCSDGMKSLWRDALINLGVDVDGGQVDPPKKRGAR
jgi:hypothetical protein